MKDADTFEDVAFVNSIKTSDAISLAHRFIDYFIGQHREDMFCSVAVVDRDGGVLVHANMPHCQDKLSSLALMYAHQAVSGSDSFHVDKNGADGKIKGHFGGVSLPERSLCVGFYVRKIRANRVASIIRKISSKMD